MRYLTCILLFLKLLGPVAAAQLAPDDAAQLLKRANLVAQAFDSGDLEAIAEMTHPSLFRLMGGKDKMLEITKAALAQLESMDYEILESKLGTPGEVYQAAEENVCFYPRTTVMRIGDKKARSTGFLICVRTVPDGEWLFLDGSGLRRNPELLRMLLPALPDDLELPENKVVLLE